MGIMYTSTSVDAHNMGACPEPGADFFFFFSISKLTRSDVLAVTDFYNKVSASGFCSPERGQVLFPEMDCGLLHASKTQAQIDGSLTTHTHTHTHTCLLYTSDAADDC